MIRIHKSPDIPKSLRGLVPPLCEAEIDTKQCTGADVKERLMADQYGKCAYCECRLNGDFGHIEHFRPKRGYTTSDDHRLHKPGYYWLAYDWDNMLLSCATCNSAFKKNLFDLRDEGTRDIEGRDTHREEPLLINPAKENPQDHIVFQGFMAQPRLADGKPSDKGAYTIDLLQLNRRPDLVARRRRTWLTHERLVKISKLVRQGLRQHPGDTNLRAIQRTARKELERMASPQAEYSAMFRHPRPTRPRRSHMAGRKAEEDTEAGLN